jgi:hypothetical protein
VSTAGARAMMRACVLASIAGGVLGPGAPFILVKSI